LCLLNIEIIKKNKYMNFDRLTEEDKLFIYNVYNDKTLSYKGRLAKIGNYIGGKSERTVKYWIARLGYKKAILMCPKRKYLFSRRFSIYQKKVYYNMGSKQYSSF